MKKILMIVLTMALLFHMSVVSYAAEKPTMKKVNTAEASINRGYNPSGEFSTDEGKIFWEIFDDGANATLVFTGFGNMPDFDSDGGPWCWITKNITNVEIDSGIGSIGENAFKDCGMIKSISIPDTVKSIGANSFRGTWSLENIYIPDSVTSVDNPSFMEDSIVWCQTESKPSGWNIGTGTIMYGVSRNVYDFWTGLTGDETSVQIPNECSFIPKKAFSQNSNLTSVTIPDNIKSIGENAFYGCRSLVSISIPSSVRSIEDNAFYGCSSLVSISIPSGVTSIGSNVFYGCSSLKNIFIPNSVTSMRYNSFDETNCKVWCEAESKPDGWDNINGNIIYGVNKEGYDFVTSLEGNETSVEIPEGVNTIPDNTFAENDNLTSVTIPNSVTRIGNKAFYDCDMLKSVVIPENVTSIGNGTFEGCQAMEKINIPDSVTKIGDRAFSKCNLKTVVIPKTVVEIGDAAFGENDNCIIYCKADSKLEGWSDKWCESARTKIIYSYDSAQYYEQRNKLSVSLSSSTYLYDGSNKKPSVKVEDGYGIALTNGTDYTVEYPSSSKIAGEYTLKIIGKGKYAGVNISKKYIIRPLTINDKDVSMSSSYIYSGKHQKPSVKVKDGHGALLVDGRDYVVNYPSSCKNVGTYSIKIIGKGNYVGVNISKKYIISPAAINDKDVSISSSCIYSGKHQKPSVKVKDGHGALLVDGRDYVVNYPSSSKNVGTYSVKITGKGNYSGKFNRTYTINPKGTSIVKLSKGKKAITVKWKKQSDQTTGYQIKYSQKSSMKSAKMITITKKKSTLKKISRLKAKKKYYVQVRTYKTVNQKKYYSTWSSEKSIKI